MQIRPFRPFVLGAVLASLMIAAVWSPVAVATALRPPASPTAVATVDLIRVLEGLNEKATLEAELQSTLQRRQSQLDELAGRLRTAQDDLSTLKQGTPEYREKFREALELRAAADARREVLQQIILVEKGTVLRDLYLKIDSAIKRLADREGYDVVLLDDSSFPLPSEAPERDMERAILSKSVLYKHPTVDITEQLVTLMNNDFAAGR